MALFTLSGLKGSISNFFGIKDLSEFGRTIDGGDGYIYHVFLGPTGPDDTSVKNYTLDLTEVPAASFPIPISFLYVGGGGSGGMPGRTPRAGRPITFGYAPGRYGAFNDLAHGGGGGGGAGLILYSDSEYINSPATYPLIVGGSDENTVGINSVGAALTAYAGGRGGVGVPYQVGDYRYPPTIPGSPPGPLGPWYPPTGNIDPSIQTDLPFPSQPPTGMSPGWRNLYLSRDHYGPEGIPPNGWGYGQPGGSGGGGAGAMAGDPQSASYGGGNGQEYNSLGGYRVFSYPDLPANTSRYGNDGGQARVEGPPSDLVTGYGGGGGGAGGAGNPADTPAFPDRALAGYGGPGQPFSIFAAPIIAPAIPAPYRPGWMSIVGPTGLYGGGGGGSELNISDPESPGTRAPGGGGYTATSLSIPEYIAIRDGYRWTGGGGAACPSRHPYSPNEPGQGGSGIIIIRRPAS